MFSFTEQLAGFDFLSDLVAEILIFLSGLMEGRGWRKSKII